MYPQFLTRILFFCVCLSCYGIAQAQQSLSTLDQSLRYALYSRLGLKVIPIAVKANQYKLQFIVEKIEETPTLSTYQFSYFLLNSYDQELQATQAFRLEEGDLKASTERHWIFEKTVEIPDSQPISIVLFQALDTRQQDTYTYHIDLKSPFVEGHPNFGLYYANEIPFDQNYLTKDQSLLFKSTSIPSIHSFFYPAKFEVPFPPMETRLAEVPKELEVQYRGDFLSNIPKQLSDEGYYFFQTDTTSTSGQVLRTVHEAFPKVKSWEEMVDMVTYISTKKEHETLLLAQDKKKALDAYWLNLTRDQEVAKDLIRNYFRMVEFSNILFTDYKEGWKTDRGMVYIVMGPPQQVNFFQDREIWSYPGMDESSKIRFTFMRVKTLLHPHFYTLNRSRAYQPVWFKNISQWRSGRMAF